MSDNKKSGINFIVVLLSFVIILLTVSNRMVFSFQTQTGITILLFLATLFLVNNYKIKLNSYELPLALLCVSALISYFCADYQVNVRNNFLIVLSSIFAGFTMTFLTTKSKRNVFFVPTFAGLFLAIVLFSKFLTNPSGLLDVNINFCDLSGLNSAVTASFLVLIYPFVFAFIHDKINVKVYSVVAAVIFGAVILTKSYFAIIFILLETATLFFIFSRNNSNRKVHLIISLLLLICATIMLFKIDSLLSVSLQQKLQWQTAVAIFKDNIFFGCGAGNYQALFETFRPSLCAKSSYADNIILQFIAEYGLCGLLFFALFIISFYRKCVTQLILEKDEFLYKSAVISVSAFLLLNMTNGSFFIPVNMTIFFMAVCSVFSAQAIKQNQKLPSWTTSVIFTLFFIVMIMPVIADVYYKKGIEYYVSKQYQLSAESFATAVKFDRKNPEYFHQLANANFALFDINTDKDDDYKQQFIDSAEKYTLQAISLYKNETYLRQSLGYIYLTNGKKDKAVQTLQEAEKYDKFNTELTELKYEFMNS